eukprot:CAMPEP_0114541278 /NCGR_PEP_ID=MMETSP0114-20121206/1221_1 /TAXON_ID=31324 /ORGANISM="Goniomonas sp, Strain m" /LENGTH=1701 /DNA_ID=CAMNT_0001725507 /DNA_START=110 /DNA_END=5215 /DNA_ORIENTATION=-
MRPPAFALSLWLILVLLSARCGTEHSSSDPRILAHHYLVGTIDGNVHYLEASTGKTIWSRSAGGPVVSFHQTLDFPSSQGAQEVFIPGLDTGALYVFSEGRGLHRLSTTAKKLVAAAPWVSEDGTFFLGQKDTTILAMDPATGDSRVLRSDSPKSAGPRSQQEILLLRSEYLIQARDSQTGRERWNYTFSEFTGQSAPFGNPDVCEMVSADVVLVMPGETGELQLANTATGQVIWHTILSSPPVFAYLVQGSRVVPVRLHSDVGQRNSLDMSTPGAAVGLSSNTAAVSIGQYQGQLYVRTQVDPVALAPPLHPPAPQLRLAGHPPAPAPGRVGDVSSSGHASSSGHVSSSGHPPAPSPSHNAHSSWDPGSSAGHAGHSRAIQVHAPSAPFGAIPVPWAAAAHMHATCRAQALSSNPGLDEENDEVEDAADNSALDAHSGDRPDEPQEVGHTDREHVAPVLPASGPVLSSLPECTPHHSAFPNCLLGMHPIMPPPARGRPTHRPAVRPALIDSSFRGGGDPAPRAAAPPAPSAEPRGLFVGVPQGTIPPYPLGIELGTTLDTGAEHKPPSETAGLVLGFASLWLLLLVVLSVLLLTRATPWAASPKPTTPTPTLSTHKWEQMDRASLAYRRLMRRASESETPDSTPMMVWSPRWGRGGLRAELAATPSNGCHDPPGAKDLLVGSPSGPGGEVNWPTVSISSPGRSYPHRASSSPGSGAVSNSSGVSQVAGDQRWEDAFASVPSNLEADVAVVDIEEEGQEDESWGDSPVGNQKLHGALWAGTDSSLSSDNDEDEDINVTFLLSNNSDSIEHDDFSSGFPVLGSPQHSKSTYHHIVPSSPSCPVADLQEPHPVYCMGSSAPTSVASPSPRPAKPMAPPPTYHLRSPGLSHLHTPSDTDRHPTPPKHPISPTKKPSTRRCLEPIPVENLPAPSYVRSERVSPSTTALTWVSSSTGTAHSPTTPERRVSWSSEPLSLDNFDILNNRNSSGGRDVDEAFMFSKSLPDSHSSFGGRANNSQWKYTGGSSGATRRPSTNSDPRFEVRSRYEQDFEQVEPLGKGGFGSVFRARNRLDGREYAVKKIRLRPGKDSQKSRVMREAKTMARLSHHQNVVRYYQAWIEVGYGVGNTGSRVDGENQLDMSFTVTSTNNNDHSMDDGRPYDVLFIQMQLCKHSLRQELQRPDRTVDFAHVQAVVRMLCQGLHHMHAQGFIHRDIKPDNIFVEAGVMKIGDFGLATQCRTIDHLGFSADGCDLDGLHDDVTDSGEVGTHTYASPELQLGRDCDEKTDMFSMGVILFEMLCPFQTGMERAIKLRQLRSLVLPPETSQAYPEMSEVILALVNPNPCQRPSALEVLQHPLFQPCEKQLKELEAELETKNSLVEFQTSLIDKMRRQIEQLSLSPQGGKSPHNSATSPPRGGKGRVPRGLAPKSMGSLQEVAGTLADTGHEPLLAQAKALSAQALATLQAAEEKAQVLSVEAQVQAAEVSAQTLARAQAHAQAQGSSNDVARPRPRPLPPEPLPEASRWSGQWHRPSPRRHSEGDLLSTSPPLMSLSPNKFSEDIVSAESTTEQDARQAAGSAPKHSVAVATDDSGDTAQAGGKASDAVRDLLDGVVDGCDADRHVSPGRDRGDWSDASDLSDRSPPELELSGHGRRSPDREQSDSEPSDREQSHGEESDGSDTLDYAAHRLSRGVTHTAGTPLDWRQGAK